MTTTGTTAGYPEPGEELGSFRLGRRLGVGGMGVVYEAMDTQLQRLVALKIIAPHLAHDETFRARFTREARAQASLDSTHVVQVYSFGEAAGRLYIASQLIPDGDLGQMLTEHGLPPVRVALHLLAQVADGLVDAHAAGLVHRDIKPANVLLRHRDHALSAYLADFGIARQVGAQVGAQAEPLTGVGALTSAGAMVGTPTYMAPELHTGGEAGPLCDVYSLGCLLWAALTGAAPYAGGTDYQVVSGHVSGSVPQLEATGPLALQVNRVLALTLAKDPQRRYPSAQALRDDLRRVVRLPDDEAPLRAVSSGGATAPQPSPPIAETSAARRFYAAAPPTPTPAPGPFSQAPAALPLSYERGGPRRAATGRTRRWVPLAVVVLVLALGAAVLFLVLRGGGAGSSAIEVAPGSEAQVVEVLSSAFAARAGVGDDAGECVAERVVADVGIKALIEAGLIDADLAIPDPGPAGPDLPGPDLPGPDLSGPGLADPDLVEAQFSASFTCAGGPLRDH